MSGVSVAYFPQTGLIWLCSFTLRSYPFITMTLKTIEQLNLPYSKHQLYRRIKALEKQDLISIERGGRNQILLNQDDIGVLQRLADLENGQRNLQSSILVLENWGLKEKVDRLESNNRTLKNEIQVRDNVIKRLRHGIFKGIFSSIKKIWDRIW